MAGYTLIGKVKETDTPFPSIDASALRPDVLGMLSKSQLASTQLKIGQQCLSLGDLFDIQGQSGDTLTLENIPPLHCLGAHMTQGKLIVLGNAGDHVGASMSNGIIEIRGHAGHHVGGPAIPSSILGSAGKHTIGTANRLSQPTTGQTPAPPPPTVLTQSLGEQTQSNRGMTGGQILIQGSCQDHPGLRQRGGLIYIQGTAGKSPGYRMMAGTLVLNQGPYDGPGLEMRRGTILCLDAKHPVQQQHNLHLKASGQYPIEELTILKMLQKQLDVICQPTPKERPSWGRAGTSFKLFCGDILELSKGELWQQLPTH